MYDVAHGSRARPSKDPGAGQYSFEPLAFSSRCSHRFVECYRALEFTPWSHVEPTDVVMNSHLAQVCARFGFRPSTVGPLGGEIRLQLAPLKRIKP